MDEAFESQFLDLLYRTPTDGAELKRALNMLADAFSCRSAAFVAFDAQEPAAGLLLTTGVFDEEAVQRRYLDYAVHDPAPGMFASFAVGRASTTNRMMSAEVRGRSIFNNEFYIPLGLSETLGANLFSEQGRAALIGLHRGVDRSEFTDEELVAVERLSPHLRRVLQLRRAFVGLEAKSAGMQDVLDRLPAGLLLLDSAGSALVTNRAMRDIAGRGDGLALGANGFPSLRHSGARRRFHDLLRDVLAGGPGGALNVPIAQAGRSYAVLVARAPGPLAVQQLDMRGRAAVLVVVHDPASRQTSPSEILREALGLTEGTARLVLALVEDEDLKSYAQRNGITIHTVRFHLRTALARTGTRTQSELMRMVVPLLRDFALGRREAR